MSAVTLEGNPDGGFYRTDFDNAVWNESMRLAPLVKHQAEVINKKTLPSTRWISSFIYAFSSVAYKHKRVYNRKDYASWWLPSILHEAPELNNITKIFDRDKMEVTMQALRELREQGKVSDLIWKPWLSHGYSHDKKTVFDNLKPIGSISSKLIFIGIAIYVGLPALINRIGKK